MNYEGRVSKISEGGAERYNGELDNEAVAGMKDILLVLVHLA